MRILISGGESDECQGLEKMLKEWGHEARVAHDESEILERFQAQDAPELLMLNLELTSADDLSVCCELKQSAAVPYILALLQRCSVCNPLQLMETCVDDCLRRPFDDQDLQIRLHAAQRVLNLQQSFRLQASTDLLTGIPNHGEIVRILQREMARAEREGGSMSVIMTDLDNFEYINTAYGYQAGDEVLRETARRIKECMRQYDSVGRYGGDQFLIVLPGRDLSKSHEVAERLCHCVMAAPVATTAGTILVSMSVGVVEDISITLLQQADAGTLIQMADEGLRLAKKKGKNRVESFVECSFTAPTSTRHIADFHLRNSRSRTTAESRDTITGKSGAAYDTPIKHILIVDDEEPYRTLVTSMVQRFGYSCETAANAFDALEYLHKEHFDLVVSDIRMPKKDGVEMMKEVTSMFAHLDFIIMTGHAAEYTYSDIISAGAADFINKPFDAEELRAKIGRIERERRTFNQLNTILLDTIEALTSALETRDPYTAGHQRRVADLASAIAREMRLPATTIDTIHTAGLVHDIGKISVPSEILTKPSRLRGTEMSLIKDHPQIGFDILKNIEFPWPIAQIELEHHERLNGSGYPRGLSGEDILIEARIIAVADVVEAMGSHRPYRKALGTEAALEEISRNRGILYDPDVVDACLRLFVEKGYQLE